MKLFFGLKKNYVLVSILLVLIFSFYILLQAEAGEPIPGAEIYVELEPDDEPVFNDPVAPNNISNNTGYCMVNLPPTLIEKIVKRSNPSAKLSPYKMKFYFRVPAKKLLSMHSKAKISKQVPVNFNFTYRIEYGEKKATGKFSYSFNNLGEIKDEAVKKMGPFTVILDKPNVKSISTKLEEDNISIGSKTSKNPL